MVSVYDVCLIIDFGSQYTKVIARRVREIGILSLIVNPLHELSQLQRIAPKCVILSGGPDCVNSIDAPRLPAGFLDWCIESKLPVFGICYGLQLMVHTLGGLVKTENGEYGRMEIRTTKSSLLYSHEDDHKQEVWMSHADSVVKLPDGFRTVATSSQGAIAAVEAASHRLFGVQYHPEVYHTDRGCSVITHFLRDVAKLKSNWNMETLLQEQLDMIDNTVGDGHAICALSGGVDSTVAAMLVHRVIGSRLHCIFVDNGLLRHKEADSVLNLYSEHLNLAVTSIDDSKITLERLRGVTDPESKRKIIGQRFAEVFTDFALSINSQHGHSPRFLVQGTLYTDVIESSSIKSHHNVGGLPADLGLTLLEPLRHLFKDEVRALGQLPELNLPDALLKRHPFPGPGLAVRILGDITTTSLHTLRCVDDIFIKSLHSFDLYHQVWQAFAILLPLSSVGVQGDRRTESQVVCLRAVTSSDGMTADWVSFDSAFLRHVSTRICNEIQQINRVVYDISSKPPATIEWQ